ncbi:glutamate/proton symporter GltT [soil metagenome]
MTEAVAPPKFRISLMHQIVIGLVIGCLLGWSSWRGWISPGWVEQTAILRDVFLTLIKCIIAPLIFASIVHGIAGSGDLKSVGRIGVKALIYFEIVTTLAIFVGLLVVNILKPGQGVVLPTQASLDALGSAMNSHPLTFTQTILHCFPTSIVDAMARNDVLQIVVFSVIFALAVMAAGEVGKPVLVFCDSLTQIMLKFAGIVMVLAPYGVGAAIAVTIAHQGPGALVSLGKLVGGLYVALIIFVVFVLGSITWIARIPLKPFIRAVREPFTIAFASSTSEAAMPKAFALMERFGVPPGIVGFVLPAGYTFNLDGSSLYLALASVFIAQAAETTTGIHFGIEQQIMLMLTLMITSKGVAAVPRASIVVLIAALQSFHLPLEGAAMIIAVDAVMDMARTSVNLLGNCLACVVVARWEGKFDEAKARREFSDDKAHGLPLPPTDPAA